MISESIKIKLSTTTNVIIRVAAIIGAITIIAGGYSWYLNNVWKPKVEVLFVDFAKGTAKLTHNGKEIDLEGDATYWINADWGIKFGSNRVDGQTEYDRIELVKKGMVVEYLKK